MEYAFECKKCKERFHVTQSLAEHERHEQKCPKCGSKEVEQKLEPFFAATSKKS